MRAESAPRIMARGHYGYIRVSTPKQGEKGVSLQEQRDAILRCAHRQGLQIAQWFEERETAAKRGRPVFEEMLDLLRARRAEGMIVHKIDRSARNLSDWAELGNLIDEGIDVRFASEDLDMRTRGGRLTADIQAVVAADYIRNLREEAKKGIYGRLKQGIYPLPAPVGYLNQGPGKPKTLDPGVAPLVRKAFELYAAGSYGFSILRPALHRLGLRNKKGGPISMNGLSTMLRNPFYIGLIRIKRTQETFRGAHEPLIAKSLFDRVQARLDGRFRTRGWVHDFLLRRLLQCKHCGYALIGEKQKGRNYYRCHTTDCPTKGVREDVVESILRERLRLVCFSEAEQRYMRRQLERLQLGWADERNNLLAALVLQQQQVDRRLDRLTDAYVDQLLDRDVFARRKETLLLQRQALDERKSRLEGDNGSIPARVGEFLELASEASRLYETADHSGKREVISLMTSNRIIDRKTVEITLAAPFSIVAERTQSVDGRPERDTPRTLDARLAELVSFFRHQSTPALDVWLAAHNTHKAA